MASRSRNSSEQKDTARASHEGEPPVEVVNKSDATKIAGGDDFGGFDFGGFDFGSSPWGSDPFGAGDPFGSGAYDPFGAGSLGSSE